MSAHNQAHERRMKLLNRARKTGRIYIHCEGGVALKNRDLQRLVRDGYLKISRSPGLPKWSDRFEQLHGKGWSRMGTAAIRRSFAVLTPKGAALLGMGWEVER